jgi:hypothetical protein
LEGPQKVRESLIRRKAQRQGFVLRRSARRDPLATDYGVYWLYDAVGGRTVPVGMPVVGGANGTTIDAVEHWLDHPESRGEL